MGHTRLLVCDNLRVEGADTHKLMGRPRRLVCEKVSVEGTDAQKFMLPLVALFVTK